MKIRILPLILFIWLPLGSLQVIENSDKPTNKDAGRIVKLEEVMRIQDDGSDIIFRGPYDLKIGSDNGIYFYDNWRLHKFDENGKFAFRIVDPGQGPGEATGRTYYFFFNDEIRIYARSAPKIMRFDNSGKYLGENRTEMAKMYYSLASTNNKIYGFSDDVEKLHDVGTGYFDIPYNIYEISEDFDKRTIVYSFPLINYVYRSSGSWPRANFIYSFKNNSTIYVVHTPEYKIVEFDLEKNKIEKIINRKYKRIKYIPPENRPKPSPQAIRPPEYEYYQDIVQINIHKDQLWVFTSTIDKIKGRLIDVYNMEGKYIDNFYIKFPDEVTIQGFRFGNVVLKGNYIYSIDEHEDGFYSIAKYKLNEALLK